MKFSSLEATGSKCILATQKVADLQFGILPLTHEEDAKKKCVEWRNTTLFHVEDVAQDHFKMVQKT